MENENPQTTLVLGGGPAGLTAGYLLGKSGRDVVLFEADAQVGGLAKTVEKDGYRFDLGGHRFFTKSREVDELWHEILGDEFLRRPRMSRIYWNNRYLDYPLRGPDVIKKLGAVELARCMASYLREAAKRDKVDESLEDWVTNRFGRRLYELFFKTYNEKVWGVPPSEIRAEWAAQRIKGRSFFSAAKAAFFGNRGNKVKSLISEFNYPRFGPGQMWEAMTLAIEEQGGEVRLDAPVSRLELAGGRVVEVEAGGGAATPSRRSDLVTAAAGGRRDGEPGAAARGARRGAGPPVPRLPDRGARRRRARPLPRQLDLHPRAQRPRRANSELPLVVAVDGARPRQGMRRARVLLLRRRRAVVDGGRRARRACSGGAREARARPAVEGRARLRDPRPEGLPDLRRRLRSPCAHDPRLARRRREPPAGRSQRPAPLQQLRSFDAHGDARRRQSRRGRRPRHLGRQCRERLPRDRCGRGSTIPYSSQDA